LSPASSHRQGDIGTPMGALLPLSQPISAVNEIIGSEPQQSGEPAMGDAIKLGIIICDRYRTCAGGKCLRALKNREGAFERYKGKEVELVGFATCNGCPGEMSSTCRRR